jgi:hypothetical protein
VLPRIVDNDRHIVKIQTTRPGDPFESDQSRDNFSHPAKSVVGSLLFY